MLARLDHFIQEVPDIAATHEAWRRRGFPEAWPIGPFWPDALTSGIALGGVNLELIQPLSREPKATNTLVFEPKSVAMAVASLMREGLKPRIAPKIEPDPELLALRGFPPEMRAQPQRICTNVLPEGNSPLDFFLCEYAPFLRERLVKPNRITRIEVSLPAGAKLLLARLGGGSLVQVVEEGPQRVLALTTPDGRMEIGP